VYVGDILAAPVEVEAPEDFDLTGFTTATATLHTPAGVAITAGITAVIDPDGTVAVSFPMDASLLTVAGVYSIRVRLSNLAGASQSIPQLRFVAQDEASEWHTLDSIREEWPDAEHIDDPTLWELLEVTRGEVIEFAPVLAVDVPVPDNYRLGQRMHARNTWNASRVSPDGSAGEGDFVIRPFPLDWHVKQILRPKRGKPAVI